MHNFLEVIQTKFLQRLLWCLGFACISFDKILVHSWNGYKIKVSYYLFFFAFLVSLVEQISNAKNLRLADFCKKNLRIIFLPPMVFAVAFFAYAILASGAGAMPERSVFYSFWGLFNIIIVFFTAIWNFHPEFNPNKDLWETLRLWYFVLLGSLTFLSVIVIIDYIAFFYGYKNGLIGWNQGSREIIYENSRPLAFSLDPSYLALYFGLAFPFLLFGKFFSGGGSAKNIWLKKYNQLVIILSAIVLLITFSKSIIASVFFTIFLIYTSAVAYKKINANRIVRFAVIAMIAGLVFIVITPKQQLLVVYDRMVYKLLATSKVSDIDYAFAVLKNTSYRGTGYGAAYSYVCLSTEDKCFFTLENKEGTRRESIQNLWLEVLMELGVVGVILLLSYVSYFFYSLFSRGTGFLGLFQLISIYSVGIFFIFTANWFANFSRTDLWVWLSIWGNALPFYRTKQ